MTASGVERQRRELRARFEALKTKRRPGLIKLTRRECDAIASWNDPADWRRW